MEKLLSLHRTKEETIMWWYIPLGALVGLVFGLVFGNDKPKEKEWKPKKKSPWDKDPFYGTPLQKF